MIKLKPTLLVLIGATVISLASLAVRVEVMPPSTFVGGYTHIEYGYPLYWITKESLIAVPDPVTETSIVLHRAILNLAFYTTLVWLAIFLYLKLHKKT